jgi:hypothetical protein
MDKLNTFIGDPVYPSENDNLESLREKYLQSIQTLFEKTHPEGYEIEII